jgi:hypothetical protein
MAILTQDQQAALSPEELRRRQLMQALAGGPAAGSPSQPLPAPTATPTPGAAPATQSTPTGESSTAPAKPISAPMQPPDPAQEYARQRGEFEQHHPEAAGQPPTGQYIKPGPGGEPTFAEPDLKHRLLRGLFYGMQEFGHPGEGAKSEEEFENQMASQREAARNWPMTRQQNVETAFSKELAGEKEVAGTSLATAQAAEAQWKAIPTVEQQLAKASQDNDAAAQERIIDVISRQYLAQHPLFAQAGQDLKTFFLAHHADPQFQNPDGTPAWDKLAQGAINQKQENKTTPEIQGQAGPAPNTNQWGPPSGKSPDGKTPMPMRTFGSPAEARAAWAKYEQEVKIQPMLEVAAERGRQYQANRLYEMLDTERGNMPIRPSGAQIIADLAQADKTGKAPRYIDAGQGAKALTKESLMQDIRGVAGNLKEDLDAMKDGFDAPTRAALAAAIGDPESTAGQFFQSIPRGTVLDAAQQQYVIDLFQAKENVMAMRSVLGAGQGAEDMRRAMIQTLPSAGTPSAEYGKNQINAIMKSLDRLERGIPNVPLKSENAPNPNTEKHEARINPQTNQPFQNGDRRQHKGTKVIEVYQDGQWQPEQAPPAK